MAKGGRRPGAGQPRKPLSEKLLNGNPGKRALTVIKFADESPAAYEPPAFLDMAAKEGGDILPSASEIYAMLADYIERAGCTHLIAPHLIEDYAFLRRSYLECEYMNKTHGRIAGGRRSPYVQMCIDYTKAAAQIFTQIWSIIAQNSTSKLEGRSEFLNMLKNRGF